MEFYKYQIFDDIDERTMHGFSAFIDAVPKDSRVILEITSHGGLVFYGNAVFQKIQEAQRNGIWFVAKVYGIAASSAADIVLACDRIEMAQTAAIMIHSAWNLDGKDDIGVEIANAAQLAVIRKRFPDYTAEDLKGDRWFTADEALSLGLIDSIFDMDMDSIQARLCASYLSKHTDGGKKMSVDAKQKAEEVIVEDVKEDVIEEQRPDLDEIMERIAERFELIEDRLRKIEEMNAACGDRRDNARLKAAYDRICKPCTPFDSVVHSEKSEDPKASLDKFKENFPNFDKLVGLD